MIKCDPNHLFWLNYRSTMATMSDVAPAIRALRLELKELFLLAEIEGHPHPAELARVLLMPKPTVTVIVKRLEAEGYVRREIDTGDLRRHKLSLTASGRRAATRGLAILADAYGRRLQRLSATQQAELRSILEKLT